MNNKEVRRYAELFIGMSEDYLAGVLKDECHFVNLLKETADGFNKDYFSAYTNNGEAVQTFVQYGNVVLERIGGNFYLRGLGKDFLLPEFHVKKILVLLDNMDINQPLKAAEWLAANIESGKYDNFNIYKTA